MGGQVATAQRGFRSGRRACACCATPRRLKLAVTTLSVLYTGVCEFVALMAAQQTQRQKEWYGTEIDSVAS